MMKPGQIRELSPDEMQAHHEVEEQIGRAHV